MVDETIDATITELLETWDETAALALWDSLLPPEETSAPATRTTSATPPPGSTPLPELDARHHRPRDFPPGKRAPNIPEVPRKIMPRVGTIVERSGRAGERKLLALACQPPPLTWRKRRTVIRPAIWAKGELRQAQTPGTKARPGAHRAGDDSAAPGVKPPKEPAETSARSNAHRAGDDSAAPGKQPAQKNADITVEPARDHRPTIRNVEHLPPGLHVKIIRKDTDSEPPARDQATRGTDRPGTEINIPTRADRNPKQPAVRIPIPGDRFIDVPHHVVHRTRKFRQHLTDGLWTIRFKRMPERSPPLRT